MWKAGKHANLPTGQFRFETFPRDVRAYMSLCGLTKIASNDTEFISNKWHFSCERR